MFHVNESLLSLASTTRRSLSYGSSSNDSSTSSLKYKSLRDETDIRLVRILPGSDIRSISCELVNVPLKNCPLEYEAISYSWGSPNEVHVINCMGTPISVTKNLYEALSNLRRKDRQRILWIDQLCINQRDLDEKSHQIGLMADIYKCASQVVIWLGKRYDDSDAAINLAQQLADVAQRHGVSAILNDHGLDQYGIPKRGHKSWMALGTLLQRPWFSRAWVIQEASMATSAILQCGRSCINLDNFATAIVACSISGSRYYGSHLLTRFGGPTHRITYIESYRRSKKALSWISIPPHGVLILAKSCLATDPRDKLFAFLSIGNIDVLPDYTRPVEELYIENATKALENSLQCSYICRFDPTHENCDHRKLSTMMLNSAGRLAQKLDLPSWVPDWSHQYTRRPLGWNDPLTQLQNCFSAGGSYLHDFEIFSGNRIRISAIPKDAISVAGTVEISDIVSMSEGQLQQKFHEWYVESQRIHFGNGLRATKPYVTGEARQDAFARTLLADTGHDATSRITTQYAHQTLSGFLKYITDEGPDYTDIFGSRFERMLNSELYGLYITSKIIGRVFFQTSQGYVGLAPYGVRPGDEIAVIVGGDLPVALRRMGFSLEGDKYILLGECYVHGIMDGEVLEDSNVHVTNIVLV